MDSELAVTHKPGRYFSGVRVDQLIPYLAHTIPSPLPPSVKATENLFVGSKAAHFITPFAVLPWDYKNGPQVISPRPLGKGTMSKFACAFLGAEKINQYDVVRVSGPGRKNLDFERIENGYWKYLPLSLDEALMRVSCWIAYMDEDGNTTHVNARGQLFSPFPLKAHIKVKEVTRKEEIPIPNASVQKWPHIQDIEDNDEFEMTWFQYFPSVSGDVEIPAFVEDALVISSTATTWEKVGPIETPVMALTSSNVASQYHDFEKLRSASCEAMRIEIAARWKANVDYSKFEETVLRSVDILGRFYQPNELYYWSAIHMPFTKCLQLPIELPLRLHSCSVTKFAPQRAQAFNWAGLGHIQGTSALEKDYIPNLSTKRLKDFQKAVAESVGLKAKQGVAPWEEIQAYKIDRPSNELISYHYTQAPFRYSDALDLGTVVPERLVRLIGPVNGSYEKVYGSKHVFGEDLWLDWEKQDHDENEHDLKEWQRYAAAVKEFIEEAVDEDSWYSQSETDDDAGKFKSSTKTMIVGRTTTSESTVFQNPTLPHHKRTNTVLLLPLPFLPQLLLLFSSQIKRLRPSMIYPKKHPNAFGGSGNVTLKRPCAPIN